MRVALPNVRGFEGVPAQRNFNKYAQLDKRADFLGYN